MTGKEAIAALPDSVRVGPFDIAIVRDTVHEANGKRVWGDFSPSALQIRIMEDMPTATKAVDTFLHETLHAMWWVYGVEDEDKEERNVACIATALTALYLDNLWLSGWITTALKQGT